MTISTLPTAPTRSMDQDTFDTTTAAWIAALTNWTTEANATAAAMNLNSTSDTSATSNAIGTGSKTFTVSAGKSFLGGMYLVIADTAAPSTNSMVGQVTSYSGTTLIIDIISTTGSGTKTAWTISFSASLGSAVGVTAGKAVQVDQSVTAWTRGTTTTLGTSLNGTLSDTSATVTAFNGVAGVTYHVRVLGAGEITHHGTNLIVTQGGADITTAAGDTFDVEMITGTTCRIKNYQLAQMNAALNGSASQAFSVGTPTATTHAMNLAQFADGWINSLDTWECTTAGVAGSWNANGSINVTPVSAIFRIVGADRTSTFIRGLKVKYTQSTVKYGYVLSSVFSAGNTIVTMAPNADYIMGLSSGTAITAPAFSFGNPLGFPVNISYVALVAAVSGTFTSVTPILRYSMCGSLCTLHAIVVCVDIGTGAVGTNINLPVTAVGSAARAGSGSEQAAAGHSLTFGAGSATYGSIYKYDGTASVVNGYTNSVTLIYE